MKAIQGHKDKTCLCRNILLNYWPTSGVFFTECCTIFLRFSRLFAFLSSINLFTASMFVFAFFILGSTAQHLLLHLSRFQSLTVSVSNLWFAIAKNCWQTWQKVLTAELVTQ